MSTRLRHVTIFSMIGLMLSLSTAANGQIRAYRVTDRQVQTLLDRIELRTNAFQRAVDRVLDRSIVDGTNREDSINTMIANFETATDRLKNNFASRRSTAADVEEVLSRAAGVNSFVLNNRLGANAENQWRLIRDDLNTLAGYYSVTTNWNSNVSGGQSPYYVPDAQVQSLLNRIEAQTNVFQREVARSLDRSVVDGTGREDSINTLVANFETATDRLRNNFASRRSTAADVQEVLNRGANVNAFVVRNRLSNRAESQWTMLRNDLDTLAGYYRVATNWNNTGTGTTDGYTATDAQMRTLLNRLSLRTATFRRDYESWQRIGRRGGVTEDLSDEISTLERAVQDLRVDFTNSDSSSVDPILRQSFEINNFLRSNPVNARVSSSWNQVRDDVNILADYYRVSWNWDTMPGGDVGNVGSFDSRLTGTYRLNSSQSDNLTAAIDRAITNANYNANQRDRVRANLERRLASPNMLSIDKRGSQVILSSTNAAQATLAADGVSRSETSPNGRTVRTSVTATTRDLVINYEGDRMNDYYVSFAPQSNGQLRVTRRLFLENQNETITVTSVYDKISQSPDWNIVAGTPTNTGGPVGDFIIPNNTGLLASLNGPISSRNARDGDRFSMTVTSPSQYDGAVIEGRVIGERSGVISGRATLSFGFDTIRLRNGQTYRFAGIVEQVREPDGDIVSVNNEGMVRDGSQTSRTVTRAGVGAVLGAIIGAIAGGGSGAAIGAGVGAGAGAGTVILQGRDNLELGSGTVFTITATAPANIAVR